MNTYYIYYLKADNSIYAFTNDKSIAKSFEDERNMDLFDKVKTKIEQEGEKTFLYEYLRNDLVRHTFKFYNEETGMYILSEKVVTVKEKDEFFYYITKYSNDIFLHCWTPFIIFNKDVIKALDILDYIRYESVIRNNFPKLSKLGEKITPNDIYKLEYNTKFEGPYMVHKRKNIGDEVLINELSVFIHLFGNMMR